MRTLIVATILFCTLAAVYFYQIQVRYLLAAYIGVVLLILLSTQKWRRA